MSSMSPLVLSKDKCPLSLPKCREVEAHVRHIGAIRRGNVYINYPWDAGLRFGGYKQSGNGREYAEYGLEDYLEIKGIAGYQAAE